MTQKQFYHSKVWRRLSRVFLLSKNYICERCGKPAEIAHHKRYITPENITDPAITLNPENLEAVCIDCHNAEHFSAGGAVLRGLVFTTEGDLQKRGIDHENEI